MKIYRGMLAFVGVIVLSSAAYSRQDKAATNSASASDKAFLGRWDLTLKAPDREYPSWLELREENGQLKAEMTGRWRAEIYLP